MSRFIQTLSIGLALSFQLWAQQNYQVGQRVDIDIIMSGAPERAMYRSGTVTKIEGGEIYVRLDNGEERSVPLRSDRWWVRPTQSAPPSASPQAPQSVPSTPAAQTPGAEEQDPALQAKGLGSPPNGVYTCQKIGQTYMGLGYLEIRGQTYRGMDERGRGTFYPFSVSKSGQITWSHGLTGLPESWKIRSSYYAGPDSQGRPLIRIYYRSSNGFNDLIDCLRE